jgi:hypothetical protein
MLPFFADGIDIPILLVGGLIVLVPLLAFEVFVEAWVVKSIWGLRYGVCCRYTLAANLLSLAAGVPTKILNTYFESLFLPSDLPGYLARYPLAAMIGALNYFCITLVVEGAYALRWRKKKCFEISSKQIWKGVVLANIATYVVLVPFDYFATKPNVPLRTITANTAWTAHPTQEMIYVDPVDHHLKSTRLDGGASKTIVPSPVEDFAVSADLELCLFRGTNNYLYLHRAKEQSTDLICHSDGTLPMAQVAFSPSGEHVAYVDRQKNVIKAIRLGSKRESQLPLSPGAGDDYLTVWSLTESNFFIKDRQGGTLKQVTIESDGVLRAEEIKSLESSHVSVCYGRFGSGRRQRTPDWGPIYGSDECGEFSAESWHGLESSLTIYRNAGPTKVKILSVGVRPGWLHIAVFWFGDVAFLSDCQECLFQSGDYIYLLEIGEKKVGTLAHGDRFILLTPRYEKSLN